jgi:hypothetical protein
MREFASDFLSCVALAAFLSTLGLWAVIIGG